VIGLNQPAKHQPCVLRQGDNAGQQPFHESLQCHAVGFDQPFKRRMRFVRNFYANFCHASHDCTNSCGIPRTQNAALVEFFPLPVEKKTIYSLHQPSDAG